jgi:hypothetical protein
MELNLIYEYYKMNGEHSPYMIVVYQELTTLGGADNVPDLQGPHRDDNDDVLTIDGQAEDAKVRAITALRSPRTTKGKRKQKASKSKRGQQIDRLSTAEVIERSKRRREEGSELGALRELKRHKEIVAEDTRRIAKELKARRAEAKRLDTAMDEILEDKSPEELRAYLKAATLHAEDEMTDEEDA